MFRLHQTFLSFSSIGLSALLLLGLECSNPTPRYPSLVQAQTVDLTNSIAEQLIGQWRSPKALSGQEELTFIFTPEGRLFFVVRLPAGALAAQEFQYEIDPIAQPAAIDLTLPTGEIVPTIWEITQEGQLRFQMDGTAPGQPRPRAFNAEADLFDKISDSSALPAEIVERQAQENTIDLNRAQRTYYLEFRVFATSIDQLYVNFPLDTEDYLYEIIPQGEGRERVMMTATAKRQDLRSYTGAVFMVPNEQGNPVSVAIICGTNEASTTPPAMPHPPHRPQKSEIQCPLGSMPM